MKNAPLNLRERVAWALLYGNLDTELMIDNDAKREALGVDTKLLQMADAAIQEIKDSGHWQE